MYNYKFSLVRVIDGDTVDIDIDLGFGVWLKKQRIRLRGIDTPESRTRDLEEKKCGLLAKEKLISLLETSTTLETFKDEKGKFGRILVDFIVYYPKNDKWGSAVKYLITEGYGVEYYGQSKDEIKETHLSNRKLLYERGLIS